MAEFPETRLSLIARLQAVGDGASWTEFLRIYRPVVYRMARRRGLQDADAQDVVQQVFLSISHSIEGWNGGPDEPPFRAWLTTIARNAVLKSLTRGPRDQAAGTSSIQELINQIPDSEETAAELELEAQREIVREAAEQIRDEFSAETWDLFWRTAIEGVPIAAVAAATGRTPGAIYIARHRIISRLKLAIGAMSRDWGVQEGRPPQ